MQTDVTTAVLAPHGGGHALWEALPGEIAERIVAFMRPVVCLDVVALRQTESGLRVRQLRLLCQAFALGLWPVLSLFCRWDAGVFAPVFVEGAVRVLHDFCAHGVPINQNFYAFLVTAVHKACCTKPHDAKGSALYEALRETLPRLLLDGDVVCPPGPERERFQRMLCALFRYLDRYYLKRTRRATVKTLLCATFAAADAAV